ncbi:hypothetical protein C8E01_12421 [Pontibacter virosus]|uniref:Deoxynucleoside kinase domain-containing protein n=2 Tax=Pontibacter virosus TaxID=1765052 RepID=A0A2U1AJU8_9BACT|nr:hypothetical protein C8E01_12421 [Pontibacter virosus]
MSCSKHTGRIIEIVGPPGVGKSTIYNQLCNSWTADLNWIYQDELLASKPPVVLNFKKWLEDKARSYFGRKRAKSIPTDYGMRFIEHHQELANLCWSHFSDLREVESIHNCYRSTYHLFNDFCRYQAIVESAKIKPCIIEEGLLQKSFLVRSYKSSFSSFIDNYLDLLPLSHTIIYINTSDISTIVDRLTIRNKVIASHIGKDNRALSEDIFNWQQTFSKIIPVLESRNINIIEIDAQYTPQVNVKLIKQALSNLQ